MIKQHGEEQNCSDATRSSQPLHSVLKTVTRRLPGYGRVCRAGVLERSDFGLELNQQSEFSNSPKNLTYVKLEPGT